MMRTVRLLLLTAALLVFAPTTTASAATFTFDAPAVARVGVDGFAAVAAGTAVLSDVREESALPSAQARSASTNPVPRSVATNTLDEAIAIGPSGNPGAYPFSGPSGLATRASARETLTGINEATPGQIVAANRAIGRGTASSTFNVGTFGERVVVQVQRPGVNGYQVLETVVSPDGSKFVVQKAYDATGQLVHYDPKTP